MKKALFKVGLLVLIIGGILILTPKFTHAQETTTSTLPTKPTEITTTTLLKEAETPTTTITATPTVYWVSVNYLGEDVFTGAVSPTDTFFTDTSGVSHTSETISALGALAEASRQGNFSLGVNDLGWGYYVSEIAGHTPVGWDGWLYNINQIDPGWVGMADYPLNPDDQVNIYYSVHNWKVGSDVTSSSVGIPIVFTALNYTSSTWQVTPSSTININSQNFFTNEHGQVTITPTTTATITAYIYDTTAWGGQNSPTISVVIYEVPTTTLETSSITEENNDPPATNTNYNPSPTYQNINIENAINFLTANQTDGQFSSTLYTDWAAMAFGAYNRSNDTTTLIKNYLLTDPSATVGLNDISDYARRAMALMSLDINPYSDTASNYIEKITNAFDGTQLGQAELYNDDIFGILVLLKAGYSINDEVISKTADFLLSKQTNGNWGGVDLTAATVQALTPIKNYSTVQANLTEAKNYLLTKQQTNGSFEDNLFSTSWAIQAGVALEEQNQDWVKKANNYLASIQLDDGSIQDNIWATTQVIPATLLKPWTEIMASFEKPNSPPPNNGTSYNQNMPIITPSTTKITTTTNTDILITTTTLNTTTTVDNTTTTTTELNNFSIQPLNNSGIQPQAQNPALQNPTPAIKTTLTVKPLVETESGASELIPEVKGEKIIDPPLPATEDKSATKKIAFASGAGALTIGAYLGLKLLKNLL